MRIHIYKATFTINGNLNNKQYIWYRLHRLYMYVVY